MTKKQIRDLTTSTLLMAVIFTVAMSFFLSLIFFALRNEDISEEDLRLSFLVVGVAGPFILTALLAPLARIYETRTRSDDPFRFSKNYSAYFILGLDDVNLSSELLYWRGGEGFSTVIPENFDNPKRDDRKVSIKIISKNSKSHRVIVTVHPATSMILIDTRNRNPDVVIELAEKFGWTNLRVRIDEDGEPIWV